MSRDLIASLSKSCVIKMRQLYYTKVLDLGCDLKHEEKALIPVLRPKSSRKYLPGMIFP